MKTIIARCLLLSAFILLFSKSSFALDVEAKMLANGSAILQIDGKQRLLRDGNRSPEGVLLVSATTAQALVEFEGKRKNIKLSNNISTQFHVADKTEVRIASSYGGHYQTKGLINGMTVEFMVDTGATFVAMSVEQAEHLGIDYRAGVLTSTSTANGIGKAFQIVLNSISVGNIVVHQVPAFVIVAPTTVEILLGNSYLSKVDLKIDNGVLVLREK